VITESKNGLLAMAMICTVAVLFSSASAEEVVKESAPVKADNTKVNKRDRDAGEVTADNQKQNKADVELTAKIRQLIIKDESLTTNAQNIKIISVDGAVTLKGPVKTDLEKSTVEKHAIAIAGEKNVTNQIEIAP